METLRRHSDISIIAFAVFASACRLPSDQTPNNDPPPAENWATTDAAPDATTDAPPDDPPVANAVATAFAADTLLVGDLDNDGDQDIVVLASYTRKILSYLGSGQGVLSEATISPTPVTPHSTAAMLIDVDRDGILDLVYDVYSDQYPAQYGLRVAPGRGDGSFRAMSDTSGAIDPPIEIDDPPPAGIPSCKRSLASLETTIAQEVTGDDHLDVVGSIPGCGVTHFYLLENSANGFAPAKLLFDLPSPAGVAVADLDADGAAEIIGYSCSDGFPSLHVYRLDAHAFVPLPPKRFEVPGCLDAPLRVGDVDGDGHADIVANALDPDPALQGGAAVRAFFGDGSFAFTDVATAPYPVTYNDRTFLLADFTGDGRDDILLGNGWWSLQASAGRAFGGPTALASDRPWRGKKVLTDLDGDRQPDVVYLVIGAARWPIPTVEDPDAAGGLLISTSLATR